ncbi:M15 family metallopeptidase [Rhizobium sp. TRM95111]|uniref:M15 family metallopeptidase n=1 Tax=Rhizobium alarense TaxID=2846851 RepID=UPI001F1DC150|nr:M15 family metallopeptidase [Rhizobium alarense]MCF3641116.1 M15 family metallopeptidase [Rhizobium alarense]
MKTAGLRGALLALACALPVTARPAEHDLPAGFVRLTEVAADIPQDMRYAGARNFTGRPVDGYAAATCILTRQAAAALGRAQRRFTAEGLTLVVLDCYRPQRASAAFLAWAKAAPDERGPYHPALTRRQLHAGGYIAARSGHSRGSTVDVMLVRLGTDPAWFSAGADTPCAPPDAAALAAGLLDFGSGFDCFDPKSGTAGNPSGRRAGAGRKRLADGMRRAGFRPYAAEWWHFTLAGEPFPDRYFDFPVR